MVPNIDGIMGHKIKTRKHPRHGTQCLIQYPTNRKKPSTIPTRKCNNCIMGHVCTTRCQNIWETSKALKLKNSNFSSTNFSSSFLMSQKCSTMSPHQATASSTSSLIWKLKEFTEVVESPTLPWSSLSCFKPPQVSKYAFEELVRFSNRKLLQ